MHMICPCMPIPVYISIVPVAKNYRMHHRSKLLRIWNSADLTGKCHAHFGQFKGHNRGRGGPMLTPNELVLLFRFFTLLTIFAKIDQELRSWECRQTDRRTRARKNGVIICPMQCMANRHIRVRSVDTQETYHRFTRGVWDAVLSEEHADILYPACLQW